MVGQGLTGRGTKIDFKDLIAGLLFILVAAWFAGTALSQLSLGSAREMGPGYFPLLVCAPLAGIGLAVIIQAFGRQTGPFELVQFRALILVLIAPAVFAATISGLGFVPAILLIVLISAWASSKMTIKLALGLSIFLAVFCAALFIYMLRMPVSLFGPWLGF